MSALPTKADIRERHRHVKSRTVRFTLDGDESWARAFSNVRTLRDVRLSVLCWEYGQSTETILIAMIVFRMAIMAGPSTLPSTR
jgi:hypothetical protein